MIIEDRVCLGGVHTRRLSVPGSGVPIALLHGFADSADTWRGVLTAFDTAGRAAFAVDMPGYGHADPRTPGPGVASSLPACRRSCSNVPLPIQTPPQVPHEATESSAIGWPRDN